MFTESKMNYTQKLSIIHPSTIECFLKPSPPSLFNARSKISMELRSPDYISSETWDEYSSADIFEELSPKMDDIEFQESIKILYPPIPEPLILEPLDPNIIEKFTGNDKFYAREFKDKFGDGKMKYITDKHMREMCTYNGAYYDDSMDMEEAMREDVN